MKREEKNLDRAGITGLRKPATPAEEDPIDDLTDLLPEFCVYTDEGCELAESCLECPFPHCADDEPLGRRESAAALRNNEIFRQYTQENLTVKELVKKFDVSARTVFYAINHHNKTK